MRSATLRAELLAACDAHSTRALTGHGTESGKVRRAIQRARDLIAAAPEPGAHADEGLHWLRARRAELEALRVALDQEGGDEDGWGLGGLRTVIDEIEALLSREEAVAAGPRFLPDRAYVTELLRPWKLLSLAFATAVLLWGALTLDIGDWDVGVTLLMSGLTYTTAPWSVRVVWDALRLRPPLWPLWLVTAATMCALVVDGSYTVYHTLVGNPMLRDANALASTPLYLLAGIGWAYRGSLAELITELRAALKPVR